MEEVAVSDGHQKTPEETLAALFASEAADVPVELSERVRDAQGALDDWFRTLPADVVSEAAAAGLDLNSLAE